MKIIWIKADNDYDAMPFEEHLKPTLDVWNIFQDFSEYKIETEDGDIYTFQGEALEFETIDLKFIGWVKNSLLDYDSSKHSNFYVVEEETV